MSQRETAAAAAALASIYLWPRAVELPESGGGQNELKMWSASFLKPIPRGLDPETLLTPGGQEGGANHSRQTAGGVASAHAPLPAAD